MKTTNKTSQELHQYPSAFPSYIQPFNCGIVGNEKLEALYKLTEKSNSLHSKPSFTATQTVAWL